MTLPGYENIEKRSDKERLELIKEWSDWFYARTESFGGGLGLQLAYLWPAIAKGHKIEASPNSPVVKILRRFLVPPKSVIWEYIDQVEEA